MLNKILIIQFLVLFFASNVFSAGSNGENDSSKIKTNYEKAVVYIKTAKKYEKKGKEEKAKKNT